MLLLVALSCLERISNTACPCDTQGSKNHSDIWNLLTLSNLKVKNTWLNLGFNSGAAFSLGLSRSIDRNRSAEQQHHLLHVYSCLNDQKMFFEYITWQMSFATL